MRTFILKSVARHVVHVCPMGAGPQGYNCTLQLKSNVLASVTARWTRSRSVPHTRRSHMHAHMLKNVRVINTLLG